MFKYANGFNFDKVMAAIKARNNGSMATHSNGLGCVYRAENGNACFVGCFIPEGHRGQGTQGGVRALLYDNTDLAALMPFGLDALIQFQAVHDFNGVAYMNSSKYTGLPLHEAAAAWLKDNVEE